MQASFFLGFALLGPLVVTVAGQTALLVMVAASYLVGALLCLLLPKYDPRAHTVTRAAEALGGAARAAGEATSALRATFDQLVDGIKFIFQHRTVFWPLTYLAVTASLVGVLGVLGPGFATQVLGLSERDFVVVVLPLGVGLIMGIFVLNLYGRNFSRRRGIEGGLIGLGLALLALSVAQPLINRLSFGPQISLLSVVTVVAFAAGIAYAFVAVPAQTQLQEELPENIRGRVFGVLNMLVSIASFLPIIIVGPDRRRGRHVVGRCRCSNRGAARGGGLDPSRPTLGRDRRLGWPHRRARPRGRDITLAHTTDPAGLHRRARGCDSRRSRPGDARLRPGEPGPARNGPSAPADKT